MGLRDCTDMRSDFVQRSTQWLTVWTNPRGAAFHAFAHDQGLAMLTPPNPFLRHRHHVRVTWLCRARHISGWPIPLRCPLPKGRRVPPTRTRSQRRFDTAYKDHLLWPGCFPNAQRRVMNLRSGCDRAATQVRFCHPCRVGTFALSTIVVKHALAGSQNAALPRSLTVILV